VGNGNGAIASSPRLSQQQYPPYGVEELRHKADAFPRSRVENESIESRNSLKFPGISHRPVI